MEGQTPAASRYFITWNNYPENFEEYIKILNPNYYFIWREKAPTTGMKHLHGLIQFPRKRASHTVQPGKSNALKSGLPIWKTPCDVQIAMGTLEEIKAYNGKDGKEKDPNPVEVGKYIIPKEHAFAQNGDQPKKQTQEEKFEHIVQAIKEGASEKDIAEKYPMLYIKHGSGIRSMMALFAPAEVTEGMFKPEQFNVPLVSLAGKAVLFLGPTRIGKTQYALAHGKQPFIMNSFFQLKDFDHKKHDLLVFDDCPFNHSLFNGRTVQRNLIQMDHDAIIGLHYGQTVRIPKAFPRIFCYNINLFDPADEVQFNLDKHVFDKKLWNDPNDEPTLVVSQSESELPVNRGKEEESDSEEQNAQNQMEIEDDDATLILSSDDEEEFTSVKELEGIHDAVQDNYEEWRTAKEIPKNPPKAPTKDKTVRKVSVVDQLASPQSSRGRESQTLVGEPQSMGKGALIHKGGIDDIESMDSDPLELTKDKPEISKIALKRPVSNLVNRGFVVGKPNPSQPPAKIQKTVKNDLSRNKVFGF